MTGVKMKVLNTNQTFDEHRGLLITRNEHDTGQTQQHVSQIKADQLQQMSDKDIEYLFMQVKNHLNAPADDSDLLTQRYNKNKHWKDIVQYSRHMLLLEYRQSLTDSERSCVLDEPVPLENRHQFHVWCRKYHYNDWYVAYSIKYQSFVVALHSINRYNRRIIKILNKKKLYEIQRTIKLLCRLRQRTGWSMDWGSMLRIPREQVERLVRQTIRMGKRDVRKRSPRALCRRNRSCRARSKVV